MNHFIIIITFICLLAPSAHAKCYQGDCQNAHGAFNSENGTVYVGQWQDGRYHGTGSIFHPDGSKYVGQWSAGKYDGKGILTLPNGEKRSVLFKNGQLIEEKVTQAAPAKKEKKIIPPQKKAAELPGDFPEASARLLTATDLEKKTAGELRIMLNEIYARHSHVFKSVDLQEHFSRQPWYTPKQPADWSMLSDIEKANIELIRKYLSTRN